MSTPVTAARRVPLLDLTAQHRTIREESLAAITRVGSPLIRFAGSSSSATTMTITWAATPKSMAPQPPSTVTPACLQAMSGGTVREGGALVTSTTPSFAMRASSASRSYVSFGTFSRYCAISFQ